MDTLGFYGAKPVPYGRFDIKAPDGTNLLTIHPDGTVDGAIEDASEAATVFVREVRRIWEPLNPSA